MNPVFLYFVSGESLYSGAALLLAAVVASPFSNLRWQSRLKNLVACVGLAMVIMASPPFSFTVCALFLTAFGLWFIAWDMLPAKRTPRSITALFLVTLLTALAAIEFSNRRIPHVAGSVSDHLVVIGDSISSGIDSHVPSWPSVMQEMTGIAVKNLSLPGATTRDGLEMAAKVTPNDLVVLIELGGNDELSNTPSTEFERSLNGILSKLATPGRTVVMFELPLLPNKLAFGRSQRRLAKKYGVFLIPKRCFARVISGADATSDGLHLALSGTRRMAILVSSVLSPVLTFKTKA